MTRKIRLSKSSISQKEKEAVLEVLDKEFLGMGEEVQKFEKKIHKYLDTDRDVVCVNTGTSALHIALEGLGLGEGDEVLVPTITYVASFQAVSATGATPVPCEIDSNTLFIDVEDAKNRITPNTKAIMAVHYASSSKGIEEICRLAEKFNLRVIEDAAQAFGCFRNGKMVGAIGDIVCFSFDGIKNITSGEGGAVVSSDKKLIQKIRDIRLLGVEKDSEKRYQGQRSWDFDVKHQGYRYHMSNIMAAIGIAQLDRLEQFKEKRQEIAKRYIEQLSDINEVEFLDFDYENIIPHIFVIKTQQRDQLREYLLKHNIEVGIHYKPNHLLTKYNLGYSLPIAEKVYEKILTLPCHFDLSKDEQQFIINTIKNFYRGSE